MSKWDKVPPQRKEKILRYNRQRAADSEAAQDMRAVAEQLSSLPPGQLKKLLSDQLKSILAKYGVEV